jgi:hypothetical protein
MIANVSGLEKISEYSDNFNVIQQQILSKYISTPLRMSLLHFFLV